MVNEEVIGENEAIISFLKEVLHFSEKTIDNIKHGMMPWDLDTDMYKERQQTKDSDDKKDYNQVVVIYDKDDSELQFMVMVKDEEELTEIIHSEKYSNNIIHLFEYSRSYKRGKSPIIRFNKNKDKDGDGD